MQQRHANADYTFVQDKTITRRFFLMQAWCELRLATFYSDWLYEHAKIL